MPSPSPTLRTPARDTGSQRRDLFPTAARTLPGSGRRANDILYIRVRRREGENVLHRAASNDVDNFSVDNALWITAAAEGRSLRGRHRRVCEGNVNAGTEVQTRTGRVRKSSRGPRKAMRGKCERGHESANAGGAGAKVFAGDGCSQGTSFGPMAAISRRGQGGRIYNNTRARVLLRRMCVKLADLTTHSPPKTSARPRTTTRPSRAFSHSLPAHFRSPAPRRCTPADLTTHSPSKICSHPRTTTRPSPALLPHPRSPDAHPPTSRPIPRRRPSPAPAAPPCLPLRSASGTKKRHRTVDVRCRMSRSTVVAVGHWGW